MQALHAALALYDLEYAQDPTSAATAQWLQAAQIAANFVETWQYVYNIQVVDHSGNGTYAAYASAGSQASSISTTGASTAGAYLSFESYDFFRLHLLADDATQQYLRFAEQLEYNTKLTTQLASAGQSFGYAQDGWLTEAVDLTGITLITVPNYPTSVLGWLTWLTSAQLQPQQQLQDTFGNQSILTLAMQNASTLQQQNHQLYTAPGSLGWTK